MITRSASFRDLGHIEQLYRDAPLLIIGEGTNEIQRLIIAKGLLERHRQSG